MRTGRVATDLQQAMDPYDLLCHPFYKAWSAGELTREDLREYAAAYYYQVSTFPTYLSALHSRLPDGELRRAVLRNLCEEEIDGTAHSELWLDFAEGVGAVREEVKVRQPLRELLSLADIFRRLMHSPAQGLAALYAYESQVPRIAREKAHGLRERYGADDSTCRYFDLHVKADAYHSQVWAELLDDLVSETPSLAHEAVAGAKQAAWGLWRALDGIERLRRERSSVSDAERAVDHEG